jgi:hypothetical protein
MRPLLVLHHRLPCQWWNFNIVFKKGNHDMTPEIQALPFDELRALHRDIGALIAQRRASIVEAVV